MRGLLAALVLAIGLGSGTAQADGLTRFEKELKPTIPADAKFSYGGATALGADGFVLTDVKMTITDDTPGSRPTPVSAKRVVVEDMDFDHAKEGPNFLRMRIEGLNAGGEASEWMKRVGVPDGAMDFAIDYRLDPARKVMTLNKLELAMPGLARFELSLILDGVEQNAVADPKAAEDKVSLRTATLVYEDGSLLSKLVPVLAGDEKKAVDAYVAENQAMLGSLAQGQGDKTIAILDALTSFIGDWRQPKGPLRITVSPPANLSTKDTDKLTVANALVDTFGVAVGYAGTRNGASVAATAPKPNRQPVPSSSQNASVPPSSGGGVACTPGQRLFALADGGWWPATVREATQSSGRCVIRFDGGDHTDDAVVTAKEMMAWSIDGPGRAATACKKGDRLWHKSEGAWYPAKVKSAKGASCVVQLEDDDDAEDETVELKRLRVVAR